MAGTSECYAILEHDRGYLRLVPGGFAEMYMILWFSVTQYLKGYLLIGTPVNQ